MSLDTTLPQSTTDLPSYSAPFLRKVMDHLVSGRYEEARKIADEIQKSGEGRPEPIPRALINSRCYNFVITMIRHNPTEAEKLIPHFSEHPYNWHCWLK